jgi:nitrile hydratase accessory protein
MTTSHRSSPNLDEIPGLPRNEAGPVFAAPWEAQAFAITLELHRQGVFTWREWADALAREIEDAANRKEWDDGSRYYERWLAALEKLVASKNVVNEAELEKRMVEWDEAAKATPHGKPIVLTR